MDMNNVKMRYGIVGQDEQLYKALDTAIQIAPTDLTVLIQGESGVGKEVIPRIIHDCSKRRNKRYIAINCGSIPEGTIDSELFGHEKGSFTGAIGEREGYFGAANGGTLFLDEVGELPLSTKVSLLRVLEAGEFMRVGSSKVQKTNVRVVAATNVDMLQAIADGRFREDLYYRLNAVPIHIPPLRERKEDIPLLFRRFATDFAEKYKMPVVKLTPEAQNMLVNYYWRGNVRQLKNVTEQISVIEQEREIDGITLQNYLPQQHESSLPTLFGQQQRQEERSFANEREILYQVLFDMKKDMADMKKVIAELMANRHAEPQSHPIHTEPTTYYPASTHNPDGFNIVHTPTPQQHIIDANTTVEDTEEYVEESLSLTDAERDMIIRALEKYNGNRRRAAEELNISQRTLYRRIKEYGLE